MIYLGPISSGFMDVESNFIRISRPLNPHRRIASTAQELCAEEVRHDILSFLARHVLSRSRL